MESLCGGVADVLVQSVSFSLSPHTPSPIACHLPQRIPLSAHRTVGDLPAHLIAWSSLVVVLCGFWFSQLLAIRLVPVDKLAERGSRSPSSESGAESTHGRDQREMCCASRAHPAALWSKGPLSWNMLCHVRWSLELTASQESEAEHRPGHGFPLH